VGSGGGLPLFFGLVCNEFAYHDDLIVCRSCHGPESDKQNQKPKRCLNSLNTPQTTPPKLVLFLKNIKSLFLVFFFEFLQPCSGCCRRSCSCCLSWKKEKRQQKLSNELPLFHNECKLRPLCSIDKNFVTPQTQF
jgi:hypothetical protein